MPRKLDRRSFIGSTAKASLAFTIVPRHVLGGRGYVAPNEKLNIAYIGCGSQGIREMHDLLKNPKIRITSVCDPNRMSWDYRDWSAMELINRMRDATGNSKWGEGRKGIPGGRDVGQQMVNGYYGRTLPSGTHKGCASYEDFRELMEKEKDFDTVKVMTPDHLHATVSLAAMRKGKNVVIHKPIANRMHEARVTIDTARKTGVGTHLLAYSKVQGNDNIRRMIDEGAIGRLKEIHNWSNRPVWPQWYKNPTEAMQVPEGMNWALWLGPVPDRPYHIDYTHMTFRGWYDFGGGTIADMGHYSLWPLFLTLGIETPPLSAEAHGTTNREIVDQVSRGIKNDVAFPYSSTVRFKFPAQKTLPAFELYWYDGGMKPNIPDELENAAELPAEGMMIVGEQGKIMAGFYGENPKLIPETRMKDWLKGRSLPPDKRDMKQDLWIDAFLSRKESPGSFLLAGSVTETIQLGAVALRTGKRLLYDSAAMSITNAPELDRYFRREYRPGWEI
jgi:hypothetical protein